MSAPAYVRDTVPDEFGTTVCVRAYVDVWPYIVYIGDSRHVASLSGLPQLESLIEHLTAVRDLLAAKVKDQQP